MAEEFYRIFNNNRYSETQLPSPGEDALANKGMVVSFTRIGTRASNDITLNFKAFITTFNDTYAPNWTVDKVYGRGDGIPIYNNTRRRITIGFKVPAATEGEAYENLAKLQKLIQFLYPSYSDRESYKLISRQPFVRLKFMNLLRSAEGLTSNTSDTYRSQFEQYDMEGEGLLGAIVSFNVMHNLEGDDGVVEKRALSDNQVAAVLSKMFEINLDFEPIHEHPLGWDTNGVFGKGDPIQLDRGGSGSLGSYAADGGLFPYGVSLIDDGIILQDQIQEAVYGGPVHPFTDDDEDFDALTPDGEPAAPTEEQEEQAGTDAAADSGAAAEGAILPSP
tara:strand:- start:126 stop:1127 length:1002 start_codon:yes stop_codon:yes gene_type:complete